MKPDGLHPEVSSELEKLRRNQLKLVQLDHQINQTRLEQQAALEGPLQTNAQRRAELAELRAQNTAIENHTQTLRGARRTLAEIGVQADVMAMFEQINGKRNSKEKPQKQTQKRRRTR